MNQQLKSDQIAIRKLRLEYMQALVGQGQKALSHLSKVNPGLHQLITKAFPNSGRAAFWFASDPDRVSRESPLQQLANGRVGRVIERVQSYHQSLSHQR